LGVFVIFLSRSTMLITVCVCYHTCGYAVQMPHFVLISSNIQNPNVKA
jgi:hypothetical protein